jgi:hypothetical protein
MAIIEWTREARCKDCKNLRYYYNGRRKLHKCIKKNAARALSDSAGSCVDSKDFDWNPIAIPESL